MSSYDRNIERMRAAERSNAQAAMSERTNMANIMGKRGIQDAENISRSLSQFSSTLKKLRDQHIEEQFKIGFKEYKQYKKVNAEKLLELEARINQAKGNQKLIEKLRRQQIDLKGANGYVDAERISHLSDYQQLGFATAQLQSVKDTFGPKLQDAMQNSDKELTINGVTFKTKDIHANNTDPLEFKRAGIEAHADSIWKNSGLDRYSPELLELAGVTEAFDKAKEDLNAKYTQRYNIERGGVHRERHEKLFDTIIESKTDPTGDDLELLFRGVLSTFDGKGNLMTKSGAWKVLDTKLIQAALNSGENPETYLRRILGQEIPESWTKELGIPKGTTFDKHWKNKVETLTSQARKKIIDNTKAEEKWIENEKIKLNNKYKTIIRNLPKDENGEPQLLNGQEIEAIKQEYNAIGEVPPDFIVKYETASLRNERLDEAAIKNLMGTQDGAIYHDQLDEFHPLAALKYRKEADRHEAALKKSYNVDGIIKGQLNETWADAGIKQNEKKTVWEFALAQANATYNRNFNRLIRMGYPPEQANRLALHANIGEVKGDDGEPLPEFEGVVAHLKRTGVKNDYTTYGEEANASLKDADIMVSKIAEGKEFMLDNPTAITNKIIGGKYGQNHLNTIKENMNRYGTWKGIRMSKEALLYYEGLARGKRKLSGFGLIDAQLKLDGHPGIWPDRTDTSDNDFTEFAFTKLAPLDYAGSGASYNEILLNQDDIYTYQDGTTSVWNLPENVSPFLDMEFNLATYNLFGENN